MVRAQLRTPPLPRLLAVALGLVLLAAAIRAAVPTGPGLTTRGPATQQTARPSRWHDGGLLSLPQSARAGVSGVVGKDDPRYAIRVSEGALTGRGAASGLRSSFLASGVSIGTGRGRVGLALRDLGDGSRSVPLAAVAPIAHGNEVSYRRPGVTEWYRNGPLGLEQGFTVARPIAGQGSRPLTLAVATSDDRGLRLERGGSTVVFSDAGRSELLYGGLSATDADGRRLHSWLTVSPGGILVHVDSRGARYPLRIDPFLEQAHLELESDFELGSSVALSANGNVALIGDRFGDEGHGDAWIFTREGETWAPARSSSARRTAKRSAKPNSGRRWRFRPMARPL